MRVILGIGNPGARYTNNRHNVGFMILDHIANKYSLSFQPSKNDYWFTEGKIYKSKFILIKPSTYVNNSGLAAKQIVEEYKIDPEGLLVIVDDVNLEIGDTRIRISGGDGGHNGINSIIYHLASDQFPRLRIGIGGDFERGKMAEYVLSDFSEEELKIFKKSFIDSTTLMENFIEGGTKKMLDANSSLSNKSKTNKEGNPENL